MNNSNIETHGMLFIALSEDALTVGFRQMRRTGTLMAFKKSFVAADVNDILAEWLNSSPVK
jgi:hypothetical protein